MPTKRAICVDIDNVIAQTDEVMRQVIRISSKQRADFRYEDIVYFDYWRCRDRFNRSISESEWKSIHLEFTLNHLDQIQPYPDALASLAKLTEKFEIHLATSRLPGSELKTREWLVRHHVPFSQLHFVSHRKKQDIPIPFVAAIDDDLEQAQAFQNRGIRTFLLAHPWNALDSLGPIVRVDTWSDLLHLLLAL